MDKESVKILRPGTTATNISFTFIPNKKSVMKDPAYHYLKYYTYVLLFIMLSFLILYYARLLLIPMSFAFLICFIYYPMGIRIERKAGKAAAIAVCLFLLVAFGFLLFLLLSNSIAVVQEKFAGSEDKVSALGENILQSLSKIIQITPEQQETLVQKMYENLIQGAVPFIQQTISLSAGTLAMLLIIPVFVSLIYYYKELLVKFILLVVPHHQIGIFKSTIAETTVTYFKFAKGMLMVYLIVGALNSAGFLLLGLPNAVYFGVLAAVLTFFPYIGILIGGSAAVIVAWTSHDSLLYPLGVVAVLGVVQYLEANVIFPVAVGAQLKINPLATLIAIIIGGIVWGGAGIVLFVPFAAIMKILADRIDSLQPLAVLLGPEEGKG